MDLSRFLGKINFYGCFLFKGTQHPAILNAYLSRSKIKSSLVIAWSAEFVLAFELVKRQLAKSTLLAFPQLNAPLAVLVDVAVGAVLHQQVNQI